MTRRPKTPRTNFERKWFDFHTELHDPAPLGYRRQPKGRRAKSGQWAKRTPCPVKLGSVVEQTIKAMHRRRMAIEALQQIVAERTRAKTFREVRDNVALYGRAMIHEDDAVAEIIKKIDDQFQDGWKP